MAKSTTSGGHGSRPLAIITGGARRVGRAITLTLARAGCDVVVTYRDSRGDAEATIAEAIELGASPVACRAERVDLGELDQVEMWAGQLANALPRADILVLNASSYERSPLAHLSGNQLSAAFAINAASGAVIASRLAARLAESGRGSIVAMCDIHAMGEHGLPRSQDFLAYSMSKAALAELVRTLARELAPSVRVNGVAPGVVAWPEQGHESDPQSQRAYLSRVPLGRAGTPQEAAAAVRWLALEASYITGEIVRIDGGRNLL